MADVIEFPFFRRMANGRNLYRVEDHDRFTEIQYIGGRSVLHEVRSGSYPERILVMEMADCAEQRYEPITISEFEQALAEHFGREERPLVK